jgi:hypothetical protein
MARPTGEVKTRVESGGTSFASPAADDDKGLYVCTGSSLSRLDMSTGDIVWDTPFTGIAEEFLPTLRRLPLVTDGVPYEDCVVLASTGQDEVLSAPTIGYRAPLLGVISLGLAGILAHGSAIVTMDMDDGEIVDFDYIRGAEEMAEVPGAGGFQHSPRLEAATSLGWYLFNLVLPPRYRTNAPWGGFVISEASDYAVHLVDTLEGVNDYIDYALSQLPNGSNLQLATDRTRYGKAVLEDAYVKTSTRAVEVGDLGQAAKAEADEGAACALAALIEAKTQLLSSQPADPTLQAQRRATKALQRASQCVDDAIAAVDGSSGPGPDPCDKPGKGKGKPGHCPQPPPCDKPGKGNGNGWGHCRS